MVQQVRGILIFLCFSHILVAKRNIFFPCTGSGTCSDSDSSSDFTCISQSLRFDDTQRSQIVSVAINDDNITEGVEVLTVTLSLQNLQFADSVNVTPAVATVRILDNDSKLLKATARLVAA